MRDAAVDAVDPARHRIAEQEIDEHGRGVELERPVGLASDDCVCRSNSGTAMTDAMALSLMAMTKSDPSAGSMRISACGRMMVRNASKRLMPRARAACIWLRRTEVSPARTVSLT
jgi:hypothetical protein